MSRRRFFVNEIRNGTAELAGESAAHLTKVLRVEAGQKFEVSDNHSVHLAQVTLATRQRVRFEVLERVAPSPPGIPVILLASLIKFDRFEWLVEKTTELGVERIVPLEAVRSEKGLAQAALKRAERWRKIALEASQQSRRDRLPEISEPARVPGKETGRWRFYLEEEPGAPPLLAAFPLQPERTPDSEVVLAIGPEGGWTAPEREIWQASGYQPVSLGSNILRAETAAVVSVGLVRCAWQASTENGAAVR